MTQTPARWQPTADYLRRKAAYRAGNGVPVLATPSNQIDQENARLAQMATEAPRIPWDTFVAQLDWRQGEHFGLIGPTGQGKTTMLTALLPLHPYVVVFATKPADDSMDNLLRAGYIKIERWQSLDPDIWPRRVLWPNAKKLDAQAKQKEVFSDALARIYREGGWTVAFDELWYVCNVLKLERDVKTYLLQARSLSISLILATQRPAWVPLEVYDQSTHLMFWRDNDERNLSRISGISYRSSGLIRSLVSNLDRHQVLYINTRTGYMARTRCPHIIYGGEGK